MALFQVCQVENIQVNDQQVYLLLNEFNIYKSQGPDEIHPSILKVFNPLFISAVTQLFKSCVKYDKITEIWKQSHCDSTV